MKIAMTALMLAAGAHAAPAPGATTPAQTAAPVTNNAGARKAGKATNKQKPRQAAALPVVPGARFIAPVKRADAPPAPAAPAAPAAVTAAPAAVFPAAKATTHKFGKAVNKQKPRKLAAALSVGTSPPPAVLPPAK